MTGPAAGQVAALVEVSDHDMDAGHEARRAKGAQVLGPRRWGARAGVQRCKLKLKARLESSSSFF
jgi:hypothetical protein